jgi:uncharacterized RDD family membrane protein YckC
VITTRRAGFWIRAVAALLDFGLFAIVKLSLGVLAARVWRTEPDGPLGLQGTIVACTMLFVALYTIVLHALEGQTVGKLIVGVRVVGLDGDPPPLGTSVLRFFAYAVSLFPFALGFVMAGLRSDRRALHDLLAGTRVERLAPPASPTASAPEPEQLIAPPVP